MKSNSPFGGFSYSNSPEGGIDKPIKMVYACGRSKKKKSKKGTTMAKITPIQFKRSMALAHAYEHLWAREMAFEVGVRRRVEDWLSSENLPPLNVLRDLEIEDTSPYLDLGYIETISMKSTSWEQSQIGICAPEVDANGNVVHTTYSGRLTWCVEPNGVTTLIVSRPCGDVLRAVVAFEKYSYLEVLDPQNIHRRHVRALREALIALQEQITWRSGDHGIKGLTIFEQTAKLLYSSSTDSSLTEIIETKKECTTMNDYVNNLALTEKERQAVMTNVRFATLYAEPYAHGTPGHISLLTIYALADLGCRRLQEIREGAEPLTTVEEAADYVECNLFYDGHTVDRMMAEIRLSVAYIKEYNHLGKDGVLYTTIALLFNGLVEG